MSQENITLKDRIVLTLRINDKKNLAFEKKNIFMSIGNMIFKICLFLSIALFCLNPSVFLSNLWYIYVYSMSVGLRRRSL